MITKKILLILTAVILVCIAIYYYGFTYAFRDFSGSESWRPIDKYPLYAKKDLIEKKIDEMEKSNSSFIVLKDSAATANNGFFSVIIVASSDTIIYNLMFPGNDSIWNSSGTSKILLMGIKNSQFDITYSTLEKTDKKEFKKLLELFENNFIDSLKGIRNPD